MGKQFVGKDSVETLECVECSEPPKFYCQKCDEMYCVNHADEDEKGVICKKCGR